jgi:ATP-dependent Lon protease
MSEALLPLFPLQVVLFPGSSLPLHIFEERYRILVAESFEGNKEFGINLLTEKRIAEIGCTAVVKRIVQRYDDGRLDIVVEGKRRYRLHRYDDGKAPYLVGWVEFLPASGETPDRTLLGDTIILYNKLVSMVFKGKVQELARHLHSDDVSFLLAQKAGMDLIQRQLLLETENENERLRLLHQYLSEAIPKLERLEEVERVIRSDGYL